MPVRRVQRRNVLLIAYHYPPLAGSSGLQRTLAFSRYLSQNGWRATVLTATPSSYEHTSTAQLQDIPADVEVKRCFAPDAARHLSLQGRYWSRLGLPDRWMSWQLTAVATGLHAIRHSGIDAIWSTFPIATAHLIAARLHKLTGLPWLADFRDPMVERIDSTGEEFPKDPSVRNARLHVEAEVARHAARSIFCTEAARQIYLRRYPSFDPGSATVISNGFDEHAFADLKARDPEDTPPGKRLLLHSGMVYLGPDRDPSHLMRAIRSLAVEGVISRANFELRLRAPSNENALRRMADDARISDLVSILPPLPYREALGEMMAADGLLVLQGYTSNPAVPAKLYEYIRTGRPIVGLVHPDGETAATLRSIGASGQCPLTDEDAIADLLRKWLHDPEQARPSITRPEIVERFSRQSLTTRLAQELDEVTGEHMA